MGFKVCIEDTSRIRELRKQGFQLGIFAQSYLVLSNYALRAIVLPRAEASKARKCLGSIWVVLYIRGAPLKQAKDPPMGLLFRELPIYVFSMGLRV